MGAFNTILLLIVIAAVLYLKLKLPAIKGKIGEKKVSAILSLLPKNKYVVLNDILLKNGAHSTQIDHIIVSVYGIFVIETKNYKGWIIGNSYKDYWTQNIWGNKYSFYNPVIQNNNHINFLLRKYPELKEKAYLLTSLIVFMKASRLILSGESGNVIMLRQLYSHLKQFSQETLSIDDCRKIAHIIQSDNIINKTERKAHKYNVKTAISNHTQKIHQGRCPLCGGILVERIGKYGHFLGCSNFPRCRFTK